MTGVRPDVMVQLKVALHQSRNYIKCDSRLHVSRYSRIPDHCNTFALSDASDKDQQRAYGHVYDQR